MELRAVMIFSGPRNGMLARGLRATALVVLFFTTPVLGENSVLATFKSAATQAELEGWLTFRDPTKKNVDRALALQEMILVRALAEEAVRLGLDREPAVRIELLRKDSAIAQRSLQRQLNASIRFTEEEIEAKYRSIRHKTTRPRRVRLRNIFQRYPPDADAEERAAVRHRMDAILERLRGGEDFAELAAVESDSQTRLRGGLIGNARAGDLRPEVDAVAMALEEGQVSEILEGPEGLTILYCERILPEVVRTPDEMREVALGWLETGAYREGWWQIQQDMLASARAVYHWDAIGEGDGAGFVEFRGGSLSRREVRVLALGRRTDRTLADVPRETVEQHVNAFLTRLRMIPEVYVRGLADEAFERDRLWTRRQVLAGKALAHHVQQRLVTPSAEEIARHYEAHKESYERPAHYHLAIIALVLDSEDPREAYRQGERIVHRLRRGELDFAEAARRYSEVASAQNGGDVGWVSRWAVPRRFGIDFLRAMLRMEVGERSDIVESEGALYIFELRGLEDRRPMSFEEARVTAENQLGNQRVKALEAEVTEAWLAKLGIEVREVEDATSP